MDDNIPMTNTRILHETPIAKDNYFSSNGKIDKFSNYLLYLLGLKKTSPYSAINFWFESIGQSTNLQSIIYVSFRISRAYFLSKITPSFDWTTSMPKKYLRLSRFLVWKWLHRCSFNWDNLVASFSIMTISSIYAIKYTHFLGKVSQ